MPLFFLLVSSFLNFLTNETYSNMSFWATLIFLGISFSALYVLPSGNPQPTDWLIAAASGGVLLARVTRLHGWRLVWPMILISLWVLLVSITWSLLHPEGNFWKPPMFFLFNALFSRP